MAGTGIFDADHPPSRDLADDCVHCGFCLPSCPTYVLWGREADSPRGRIYLLKAGLDGRAAFDDAYRRHFDTCLGCMACLTACPSGVRYDRLIEATRPQLERRGVRSLADRAFRKAIFSVFPHPSRLRALAWPLWLYQKSGLQAAVRAGGIVRLLPRRLAAMERLLPPISSKAIGREFP
ncbi:MAG TPA: 4Fe-4S dicluster domain-containing protein, partial [Vicinamibacterales bacterium]